RSPNFQIRKRNSLTVEHAENVMIGLHKESCRIGEGLIPRKPCCLGMPVRADDGQLLHTLIKRRGCLPRAGLGRKQTIWMDQHNSDTTWSLRIGERRCGSGA